MFYKTEKSSDTGKKFAEILIKSDLVFEAQKSMCEKYGFKEYRPAYWCVWGGFSSCIFKNPPNIKLWKNVHGEKNEWMPRLTSKEGKQIQAEFSAMPKVQSHELNMCIGFNGAPFKTIGFTHCDTHFGFTVGESWKVKIPEDCTEITKSEYDRLFN
jgi:hypothetical protein